ncbi:MAG: HEAT repeat domain-containing protein [Halodesulfurarchaeum sp.]
MSDEDTEPAEESDDESVDPTVAEFKNRLEAATSALEDAETEADLDDVEATLEDIETDLEDAEIPVIEPEDEDEEPEDPKDDLEDELSSLRDGVEDQRGPYGEDVVSRIEDVMSTISDTRWAQEGEDELVPGVDSFLASAESILDEEFGRGVPDTGELLVMLEEVAEAVESADLDADDDADTIDSLLDAIDDLENDVEGATAWSDLEVREQLRREGFYEPLEGAKHKDFPPEWSALKTWEKRNDVDMVLLLLEKMGDSEFMARHCIDALKRMGESEGLQPLLQHAKRRNHDAVEAIGKIGDEQGIGALEGHAESEGDPELQTKALAALGAIGSEDVTETVAQQLAAESEQSRSQAARSLGMIGDARAVAPLSDVLADAEERQVVRASAAWALCEIATEAALEAAAEYVDDRSYLVEKEAEKAERALASTA